MLGWVIWRRQGSGGRGPCPTEAYSLQWGETHSLWVRSQMCQSEVIAKEIT